MLAPKKTKHRKAQVGREHPSKYNAPATRGTTVSFGSFGMKAMEGVRMTANQIEAARRVLSRSSGKGAKIWIRIFPDRPFTQKAAGVRMGSGKGNLEGYVCEIRPGRVLFELDGVSEQIARTAITKASKKLPIKTRVVARGQ
jgi:large subunit ribosomal protein L16